MKELLEKLRAFNAKRSWDRYHSPKNLAMALMIETAELAEHFLWDTQEESRSPPEEKRPAIKEEIGDVMIYLLNLADKLGIDPVLAALDKIDTNEHKYPTNKARGRKNKWVDYCG